MFFCGFVFSQTAPERVIDATAGNAVKMTGTDDSDKDYLVIEDLNLDTHSYSFSCWVKPNGVQNSYAPIFTSQGNSTAFALSFKPDGANGNKLGMHPGYAWNNGPSLPLNEWSYVAFVSNGTDRRVYVNGSEVINTSIYAQETFTKIWLGYFGRSQWNRYAKMQLDEVSIWNRALTKDEVREWRHLTKSDTSNSIFNGLVAYYQFNEVTGTISLNKAPGQENDIEFFGVRQDPPELVASPIPVFDGVAKIDR